MQTVSTLYVAENSPASRKNNLKGGESIWIGEQKNILYPSFQEKLKQAKLGVLTNFNAMNVEKMESLRNALRKNDAEVKVG